MLFDHGRLVTTPGTEALPPRDLATALVHHCQGRWGNLSDEEEQANNLALKNGGRLFSVHRSSTTHFYIVTKWDRSFTAILLRSDYSELRYTLTKQGETIRKNPTSRDSHPSELTLVLEDIVFGDSRESQPHQPGTRFASLGGG